MKRVLLAISLLVLFSTGWACQPTILTSVSLADGAALTTPTFDFVIRIGPDADASTLTATLNGAAVPLVAGPITFDGYQDFTASYAPGAPLRDRNVLDVGVVSFGGFHDRARRTIDWLPPKARARRIANAADLISGPLGHSRVGDYLLENDVARFAIQDAPQRDLHSVGQYGGDLIDAELVGREGRDAFLALSTSLNIETVVNPTSVVVVNDGQDGTPAILRACGPDDLLDYVNASSQVASLGATFPAIADDQDHGVEACVTYTLAPGRRSVALETTVFNNDPVTRSMYPGYYVNGGGTLEQWQKTGANPSVGMGEILAAGANFAFGYSGFDSSEGVDYGIVPIQIPGAPIQSGSFTTSGVTFLLHSQSVVLLLGFPAFATPPLVVPSGESRAFTSHFAVGDGSTANTLEVEAEVKGLAVGTIEGCVTAGGAPLPGARVAVGPSSAGALTNLVAHFVTDAAGCYSARIPAGTYSAIAGKNGYPYEGGAAVPALHAASVASGGTTTVNFALPATGRLVVDVSDESGQPVPARISVIGFDPSPEPIITAAVAGLPSTTTGVLNDITRDRLSTGFVAVAFAGASGQAALDLEPGSYQVYVSRGGEYSLFSTPVTIGAGAPTNVSAQIAHVLDTTGFVSSDYHVHMVNSPDSRIVNARRVESFAAEGVDNLIATDHDAITDLTPSVNALGLAPFLHTTIGEEITTFDYGHFNAYPQAVDPVKPSGGSTDWAGAAAPGADFPSAGSYGLTPAQIEAAAKGKPQNAGLPTVVQINHIDSHFNPLQIDTAVTPPRSFLGNPAFFRLSPSVANFFHPFGALELWNGSNNTHQAQFLDERIGIWMNLLNQGIVSTAIADTDTHTVIDLETAGARTWTPSSSDAPGAISDAEIASAVSGGRAVGGQGLYVQARLVEEIPDAPPFVADFSLGGSTSVGVDDGSVDLEIRVQAPLWAPYDTIEIYRNAATQVAATTGGTPTLYDAVPTTTLTRGVDFSVAQTSVFPSVPGAERLETQLTLPLSGLTQDEWIVVVVKGTSGNSAPMFPVYPRNLTAAQNPTLPDLVNVTASETGVRALGFTNALFVDVDGDGQFDPPGVTVVP